MLASAVQRFASDIQIISENIKTKHLNQIKGSLQKKAFNEAGLVLQQVYFDLKFSQYFDLAEYFFHIFQ